jgi:hypothetical protein
MTLFKNFERAFKPMTETVSWRQDAAPHKSAGFKAVVLQGSGESSSAGHSAEPVSANAWSVIVPAFEAIITDIKIGDTIRRMDGNILTVQQVTRGDVEWIISCTSEMRAPGNG